jgi:GDPmannose 4,6-dehydratase
MRWEGKEAEEVGICAKTGRTLVRVDPRYYRPTEVEILHGDPTKAHEKLGWRRKVDFPSLVEEMVKADITSLQTPGVDQN